MTLQVSAAFDGGNIEVRSIEGNTLTLAIRRDAQSDFYQWFYFRVSGARGRALTLRITGLAGSAFPGGWPGYRARMSADRVHWRQANTRYAEGTLTIAVTPASDDLWVAYFAPYPAERHLDLLARVGGTPGVITHVLDRSLEGRDIDMVRVGTGPKQVWLYARQHPGETMAGWWAEGALEMLTDAADPVARALLTKATVHIVPNMCPDGSARGHLRTNAAGVNLNREWNAPTLERSPEVKCVLDAMIATGVDFALDVHGDEAIPHVFIAGFEGIPTLRPGQVEALNAYKAALVRRTPDFQTRHGYPVTPPGKANLTMSTNAVAERFGCVAATLEMPFKDNDDLPDAAHGWSPERSKHLAHACLGALLDVIDTLPGTPPPATG